VGMILPVVAGVNRMGDPLHTVAVALLILGRGLTVMNVWNAGPVQVNPV